MKKLSIFAAMSLAVAMNYSCADYDNPTGTYGKTVIELDHVKYETDLVTTFKAEPGTEVTLKLGVYDGYDIYGVDFGDGNILTDTVGWHNGGVRELGAGPDETPKEIEGTTHTKATEFSCTVSGDGTIKVYGNSDLYLVDVTGALPENLYDTKLANVVELKISGVNVEEIFIPALESLKQLSIINTPVKSVDISKAVALETLNIYNTSVSAYEPQLEKIDITSNTELKTLLLGNDGYKKGKLTRVNMSQNTKLENVSIANNEISSYRLPDENNITIFNACLNNLTEFDASKLTKVKNLQLYGNQLSGTLDLSAIPTIETLKVNKNQLTSVIVNDVTKQFWLENNYMTFATLPQKPEGLGANPSNTKFKYTPQADIQVPSVVSTIDLSWTGATATSFETVSGTALVEGTDYEVNSNGQYVFLKEQTESVIAKLTSEEYPRLTLKTTPFNAVEPSNYILEWADNNYFGEGSIHMVPYYRYREVDGSWTVDPLSENRGFNVKGYATLRVNGTKETVANVAYLEPMSIDEKDYNYIQVTLNEPLKVGNKIEVTAFRYTNQSADQGALYFRFDWFDASSDNAWRNNNWPFEYESSWFHSNIYDNGLTPDTETIIVDKELAGAKGFKISRWLYDTEVYITHIAVLRK